MTFRPAAAVFALLLLSGCSADPAPSAAETPVPIAEATPAPVVTADPTLTDSDRAAIIDAVNLGNFAAIETYLADSVTVIHVASECCGPMTAPEAIDQLVYIGDAVGPWNFSLDPALIDAYRDGDYAQYVPDDVIIGKSADDYIVAFTVDIDRITTIFMSIYEDPLLW